MAVNWLEAWTATGAYLEQICRATGIERPALVRQDVLVVLTGEDGAVFRLPFSSSLEDSQTGLVDDTELARAEADIKSERPETTDAQRG